MVVWRNADTVVLHGSLAAALQLPSVAACLASAVTVVVCVSGRLAECVDQCRSAGVTYFDYNGTDQCDLDGFRSASQTRQYVGRWQQMCANVESARMSGQPLCVLFFCVDGVHRSGAALCAYLVWHHRLAALMAVKVLVRALPIVHFWNRRSYFVHALVELHVYRVKVDKSRSESTRNKRRRRGM